jgi:hypothetical protein
LLAFQWARLFNGEAGEGNRESVICLGWFEAESGAPCLLKALRNTQHAAVQINIFPTERQNLAPARPGGKRDKHWPIDACMLDAIEKARGLLGRQSGHVLVLHFRRPLPKASKISRKHLLLNGAV